MYFQCVSTFPSFLCVVARRDTPAWNDFITPIWGVSPLFAALPTFAMRVPKTVSVTVLGTLEDVKHSKS